MTGVKSLPFANGHVVVTVVEGHVSRVAIEGDVGAAAVRLASLGEARTEERPLTQATPERVLNLMRIMLGEQIRLTCPAALLLITR